MPARIVAFAGIDAERTLQLEVAERAPAGIGRQIVGVEGDERVRRVIIDAAKPAAIVALEHHHLIRPDAPVGHLFAKAFRHRAEILADHHAAMRHALLRGRRQQRLERHLHIDAVVGRKTARHQIKPFQAQHVVEPDRAGIAHRGPQHLPIGLERFHFQARGVEAGEAPVLACGVQRIRRRADGKPAGDRDLFVPGIKPVGLHADRDIEIEADLHAQRFRARLACPELPVGDPLHEFDEFDFAAIGALAQPGATGLARAAATLPAIPTRAC